MSDGVDVVFVMALLSLKVDDLTTLEGIESAYNKLVIKEVSKFKTY